MIRRHSSAIVLLLALSLLVIACKWSVSDYCELRAIESEALSLVDASENEEFSTRVNDVNKLNERIEKLIKKGKPRIGSRMMESIKDESKNTWGGFVALWREQGTISAAAREPVRQRISDAFSEVLALGSRGSPDCN